MENEIDRKPGSVLNDDLSRPAIADRLKPPSGRASSVVMSHIGVASGRVYKAA